MATRSHVTEPVSIGNTMKRYVSYWTIEGWSAYLKKEGRSPLEERLQTGQLSWKLELDCNLDSVRKPSLRVTAQLELEPAVMEMAEVCCSLLGLKSKAAANARRETFWQYGKHMGTLMDLPEQDVLASQKLDEIKIRIELDIAAPIHPITMGQTPTTEWMTSLPKEVFQPATVDTVIVVENSMIPVHRSVLTDSSPIFKSLLRVASWKLLELPNLHFETVKELVKFTYAKREPDFQKMDASAVFDLMRAAEKYGLEKLQKYTEDHIASNLNPENTIDLLLQADLIGNLCLKKKVLLFIKNNKQLFSKDKFGRLENRPHLLSEILDVMCS